VRCCFTTFVSQLRDGALGDDAAPIQDGEIVGQLPAEFQILLHQKDRNGLLPQKLNGLANLVDDVRLDSLGWFVDYFSADACLKIPYQISFS